MQRLDRQRDALAAPDAKRDQTAGEAIAAQGVDQLGGQHHTPTKAFAVTSPIPLLPPVMSAIFRVSLLTALLLYFQSVRVL